MCCTKYTQLHYMYNLQNCLSHHVCSFPKKFAKTQTHNNYDYHICLPTLHSEGNNLAG